MTLTGTYHFLTTKPLIRHIYETQHEYIYILPIEDISLPNFDFKITYTDTTTEEDSIGVTPLVKGEVKVVDIGFLTQNYKAYQPAKTIEKIVLSIDGEPEQITLIPKVLNSDNARYFYYQNSLGGMDSLVCTGDIKEHFQNTQLLAQVDLANDAELESAEFFALNQKVRNSFDGFTGFKPEKEIDAIKDMILNNNVQERIENNGFYAFVPVIFDAGKHKFPSKNTNMKALTFKVRYAYDETSLDRIV